MVAILAGMLGLEVVLLLLWSVLARRAKDPFVQGYIAALALLVLGFIVLLKVASHQTETRFEAIICVGTMACILLIGDALISHYCRDLKLAVRAI